MTPPPDPVAALADALDTPAIFEDMLDDNEALDIATALHDALTAAGWSLSHDSEREALVAALDDILELLVYTSVSTVVVDRAHDIAAKARAAIEGGRS